MNPLVDAYFFEGCGRCRLGGTPACKVHTWSEGLKILRKLLLASGLDEERKWGMPCYTYQGKNIILLGAFKAYGALSFMKGSLLKDPHRILSAPGEHSQAVRMFRFTSTGQIKRNQARLKAYIKEAVELEASGKKVLFKKASHDLIPDELQAQFKASPDFKKAFFSLTPGRQRGYLLFFSSAKQSQTRAARIEKYKQQIMEGKGLQD